MDRTITTYGTLESLVELDSRTHTVKDLAALFLSAMNDWPKLNQNTIADFVADLKNYFGSPLTTETINSRKFDGENAWQIEAGSSIKEMIEMSTQFYSESDFDKILQNILSYYEGEFRKVDFIAELKYRTAEEGGRTIAAHSGYRPQVKFDFTEMQTSGQQTFIDKDIVLPGETIKAKITLLSPRFYENQLTIGMMYEFREGATVIGTGKILEFINDKLEKQSLK